MSVMTQISVDQSLSKWPIFSLLDEAFLHSLKLVCVFGSSGNEAVMVSRDDQVYALGSNSHGCLGLGDTKASFQPRKIRQLCNKGITDIVYGSGLHVMALAGGEGELFSWGHDGYGQLGQGVTMITSPESVPHMIRGSLVGAKVTQVACGGHHTLALTATGQVFAWGYNNSGQIGCGTTLNQTLPRKLEGIMNDVPCSSVSCTHASSVALSRSGELYCWGYNGNGQLGVGTTTNHHTPRKINLDQVTFNKVVCGYAHILALSDHGRLYSWGSNMYGQLGTGTKSNHLSPTHIAKDVFGSIGQIAACHDNHISGGSTLTGKVYMWGLCRGQSVLNPLLTRFTSVDDIFPCFGSSMWRALAPSSEEPYGLVQCIAERFDDQSTSDLTIIVEGRHIYVHKAILRMRCEYFQSMFQQGRWTEADKDSIDISHFSYGVYHSFLKYLYTDKLDHQHLSTEDTLGLLELADSYCEKDLKKQCEKLIWQNVTVDNVAALMTLASKYGVSTLEEQCMNFALSHMTLVIQSEGFDQLDSVLAKNFVKKAAEKGAFRS